MKPIKILLSIATVLALCLPVAGLTDQTDERLDALFQMLRSSEDPETQLEAETTIWDIWYESGQDTIDERMLEAAQLVSSGKLADAEKVYTWVINELPAFSEGWNRRATVRFYRRNFEGSLEDIEQTLRLEPRHFGAMWGLGMILGSQRDYERAIAAFEKLLEIKPNASDARPRIELLKQELAREAV